jgi:hypothetical protein
MTIRAFAERPCIVLRSQILLVAATDKKKAEPAEFDFKKTSAFTHEMDSRPDFPVSITLARGYVYSVLALGEKIDSTLKEKLLDFTKKLRGPDGRFGLSGLCI